MAISVVVAIATVPAVCTVTALRALITPVPIELLEHPLALAGFVLELPLQLPFALGGFLLHPAGLLAELPQLLPQLVVVGVRFLLHILGFLLIWLVSHLAVSLLPTDDCRRHSTIWRVI
ncbi:MAG: hypothetical protein HOV87_29335 [Catenulispora sp.]|nr:hypothetical protein [Catenulispora sp.]